jgi:hypothetical protein
VIIGVSICIPRLLQSIRVEKDAYRMAAEWLRVNSESYDAIAVSDKRISFYAEREGLIYENGKIPTNVVYVVKIFGTKDDPALSLRESGKVEYEYIDKKNGKTIFIYRNF